MIKGTTPTLQFNLPFETSIIKAAEIVLRYVDNAKTVIIERSLKDCNVGDRSISATLTQEETLALPAPTTAKVQIRVKTIDDKTFACSPKKVLIGELLKESVLE